ncbi:MAG: hypothetical protein K2G66_02140 [Alistipes sp.]|nr:hypothetical protein [Alistipes sp.]MDE5906419.1 hypothetical protein [Alistipes sp.]
MGAVLLSSCSTSTSTYNEQEEENQQKRELIIGKWACRRPGLLSGLFVFRADGTGLFCLYDDPPATQNPILTAADFRYAIFNSEITFCFNCDHDHPMTPGTICDSNMPLSFMGFTVDDTTFQFNEADSLPYTRVSQWSDVGLPDDLLPE